MYTTLFPEEIKLAAKRVLRNHYFKENKIADLSLYEMEKVRKTHFDYL